jgi:hypothetical protein
MSAGASPIGRRGRITSTGAIQPGRTGEVMVSSRGGVEAFLASASLNGAPGISEIISQVIGQAGPALKMAQEALGRENGAQSPAKKVTSPDSQT